MAVNYATVASKALAGITKAGKAMVLSRTSGGTYDEASGSYSGQVTTLYPCYGMFQTPRLGDRWYDGTLVQAGDRQVLLAASGLEVAPEPGDLIEDWTVVAVQPISPGGTDLLYRVLARK